MSVQSRDLHSPVEAQDRSRRWRVGAGRAGLVGVVAGLVVLGLTAPASAAGYPAPGGSSAPPASPSPMPSSSPMPSKSPTAAPTATPSPSPTKPTATPSPSPTKPTKPGKPGHGNGRFRPGDVPSQGIRVAAQAPVGECYTGVGNQPLPPGPGGTCPPGTRARVNSQYIFGFTADSTQQNLWWGDVSNVACGAIFEYGAAIEAAGLNPITEPFATKNLTCDMGQGYEAVQDEPWTGGTKGDNRRAQIFQYNIATGRLIDRSPTDAQAPDYSKIEGIRAAGSSGDVVLLGGLEAGAEATGGAVTGVVQLVAYRASTGEFLGAKEYPDYSQVKNFFTGEGQTFLGMGLAEAQSGPNGPVTGEVWRYVGNPSDPFAFEVVGRLTNQPTYFAINEGRLITGTWPGPGSSQPAGVDISPLLHGSTRLSPADQNNWTHVWDAGDIFPDPLMAASTQSHTVTNFGGWTYYSLDRTIGNNTLFHLAQHPELQTTNLGQLAEIYSKAEEPGQILRMKNLGKPDQQVQLLYGESQYWNYRPGVGWRLERNLLDQDPLYGPSGFGNPHLAYTGWGSAVFQGKLYLGGADVGKIFRDVFLDPETGIIDEVLGHPVPAAEIERIRNIYAPDEANVGGDTYVFDDANSPARAVTINGFNNTTNLGNRGLIAIGDKYLFFGTNSLWNYPSVATFRPYPARAGWQLLKMDPTTATSGHGSKQVSNHRPGFGHKPVSHPQDRFEPTVTPSASAPAK